MENFNQEVEKKVKKLRKQFDGGFVDLAQYINDEMTEIYDGEQSLHEMAVTSV